MSDTVRRPGALTILFERPAGCVGALLVGTVVALAVLAPWIAPHDPIAVNLAAKLRPPGPGHWLGTDQTGRDLLSRILWGARPSLSVGIVAVLIGLLGGCSHGLTAGYYKNA